MMPPSATLGASRGAIGTWFVTSGLDKRSENTVELRGFEPLTSCMPYRPHQRPDVAWYRPAGRSPAATMAQCGLTSRGDWRRWLPTWLPASSVARPPRRYRTGYLAPNQENPIATSA